MATTTVPIPLTTLPVGSRDFGPVPVDDTVRGTVLTVDRTVAGGLNSQPAGTEVGVQVWESDDGGTTWLFRAGATFPGGIHPSNQAGDPYLTGELRVDLNAVTGRRVRATVVVAGASVAVAGSLVIS